MDAHAGSVKSVASGSWPCSNSVSLLESARSRSGFEEDPVFATAGMDGTTRVWRVVRREELGADAKPTESTRITSVGYPLPYAATCVQTIKGHTAGVRAVAMTSDSLSMPNSSTIATGSYDRTARLWRSSRDNTSDTISQTDAPLGSHGDSVLCLTFTPDGTKVVTGAGDGSVKVWDCSLFSANDASDMNKESKGNTPLVSLDTEFGSVRCVAVADISQSPLAATGGEDGTVRVWSWRGSLSGDDSSKTFDSNQCDDSPTCELMLKGHFGAVTDLAICPGASKDGHVREKITRRLNADITFLTNPFRVCAGGDTGSFGVWGCAGGGNHENFNASEQIQLTKATGCKAHVVGAVRGCLFLNLECEIIASTSEDRTVRLWDLQRGTCLASLVGAKAATETVSFSIKDGGNFLFVGIADGSVSVWKQGESIRSESSYVTQEEPPSSREKVAREIEARLTLGLHNVLAPTSFREEQSGEVVGVDAVCIASANQSAVDDAEAFLPRIDKNTAMLVGQTVGSEGTTWNEAGNPEVVCAICRCPVEIVEGEFSGSSAENSSGNKKQTEWCLPLPCGHVFHAKSCLIPWVTQGETSCPLCRKRVVRGGGDVPVACLWTSR